MPAGIRLDHVSFPVTDFERSAEFYRRLLDAEINDFEIQATKIAVGALDDAFRWPGTPEEAVQHLTDLGIPIEQGPVPRSGGMGKGVSVYFRDPDGDLLEFISDPDQGADSTS